MVLGVVNNGFFEFGGAPLLLELRGTRPVCISDEGQHWHVQGVVVRSGFVVWLSVETMLVGVLSEAHG